MDRFEKGRLVLFKLDYNLTNCLLDITDDLSPSDKWWKLKDYLEDKEEKLIGVIGNKTYWIYRDIADAGIYFTDNLDWELLSERDTVEALLGLHVPVRDCLIRQIALLPPEKRPKKLLTKDFPGPIHHFIDKDETVAVEPVLIGYLVENSKPNPNCRTDSIALYNQFRKFLEDWYLRQYGSKIEESDKDLALPISLINRCEKCPYTRLNIVH